MQDKLIIYLHAHDLANPDWATGSYTHRGETESLAAAAKEREVVVIVPPEDVLLLTVALPKMSRSRLLQAIPFALEEQLIPDVETLHFAAGQVQADGGLTVAVVAHEKMQAWLALLNNWGVNPTVMMSAVFALPVEEGIWHIALTDTAFARTGHWQGFGCDLANLPDFFQAALSISAYPPTRVILQNYTDQPQADQLKLILPVTEKCASPSQFLLDSLASEFKSPCINLLQEPYAMKSAKMPQWKLGWKVAAGLGMAWIAMLFIIPMISSILLGYHLHGVNQNIAGIYRRYFPQATSIVAPKLRLQEKWQQLSASAGEDQSLQQLGFLGKALAKAPGVKIKRFDYQRGESTIELTAASSDDFSAFTDFLAAEGVQVKQQNANLVEGRISATIQISAS